MRKHVLAYCIALGVFLGLFAQMAHAQTLFQDTFDTESLNGWTVTRNFSWENRSQPCYNGAQPALWQVMLERLGIRIDGRGCYTEIIPKDFHIPPDKGYVFEFDMTMPESMNMDRGYLLRYVDEQHAYAVKILGNEISIGKGIAGAAPIPQSLSTYPFEANGTYHIRNEVGGDHSFKIFVDGHKVIDIIDIPPYTTGGTIGFNASVGSISTSEVWFDNVVVSTLQDVRDTVLDVPYYSQRDPLWAKDRYDSAESWAGHEKTDVERWGCALTSAVMLLRYHNITDISPDVQITPATLNTWLKAQPDGYVGDGLVNWIAITRLTKQFTQAHPSVPSLEYTYTELTPEQARQELQQQRPFIVELPKHFVLARGQQFSDSSLIIHDPLTQNKTTLPVNPEIPFSSRVFTPSFTDLRYILVSHSSSASVLLFDQTGNVSPSHTETIHDDIEGNLETAVVLHHIAKPQVGAYVLKVDAVDENLPIQVYAYDKSGEVRTASITEIGTFDLIYGEDGSITVHQQPAHGDFLQTLEHYYGNNEIHAAKTYYHLRTLGVYLRDTREDTEARRRYTDHILNRIDEYASYINLEAKRELRQAIYD